MNDNRPMHALRTSSRLFRLVLAWFALAIGVAAASPILHPKAMELVCSADGGIKLVAADAGKDGASGGTHTLDCALCLPAQVPLVTATHPAAIPPSPLAHALQPIAAAHIAAWAGAPLPPRGPPRG